MGGTTTADAVAHFVAELAKSFEEQNVMERKSQRLPLRPISTQIA